MEISEYIMANEKTYHGKKAIKYVFCEGNKSDKLIVTFPGFASPGIPPMYNYVRTLVDCDCHRLFVLDDHGPGGSYFIGENGDHSIEESVVSLISDICDEQGIKPGNVILQGSSKGGYCALYFGIKYNFGYVIAGAPQINLGDYVINAVPKVAEYITGGREEEDIAYLNSLLYDLVDLPSESFPEIFIHVGKGDHHYTEHILPFVEKIDKKGINYEINLGNYSSHEWVGSYYQEYLLKTLNHIDHSLINPKPSILKTTIEHENGILKVTCTALGDNLKFACYIFKERDIIENIRYQNEPVFKYPINSEGTYRVRVFVMENSDVNSKFTDEIIINDCKDLQKGELLLQSIEDDFDHFFHKKGEITNEKLRIKICDYLLDGNLFINTRIPKSFTYEQDLKYDVDNFDWEIVYPLAPNICQLFLQAFLPIKYLIQGYNINSNDEYLDLASELIKSWLEYELNSNNRFTWYDHSASDRVLIMIYFILTIKKNNISKYGSLINKIDNSIRKHAEFLYDDDNYLFNNHGTMVDRALYITSVYLDSDVSVKYRRKSIDRLKKAVKINFSDQMIYLENSIGYHLFTLELFFTIEKFVLNLFGDSLEDVLNKSSIEKSIDFLIHCSKPDLIFPMIGDMNESLLNTNYSFILSEKDYPPLEWLLSSGESGKEPQELFKVYPKEGYAFFRTSWDMTRKEEIVHSSFRSGFLTTTHKHADDLSFTLYAKGKDIFVDPGNYTYEQNVFKDFLVSALAHNTVVVDDGTYSFLKGNNEDTGIIEHGEEEYYSYVVGKNDMYHGVNITRSLYFLKRGDLVIVDDIQSHDVHEYSQYYHLGSKINITDIDFKLEDNNTLLKIFDDNLEINIFQLGRCDVKLIKGDKKKARPGLISEVHGHLKETTSLKFSLKSDKTRFITLITVNDINEVNNKQCYIKSGSENGLKEELIIKESEKEIKIPLKRYSRKMSQHLHVEQKDRNQFTFTITNPSADELFAWYILKNGERIHTVTYSPNHVLNYRFTEPGNYQINYFIMKNEQRKMHTLPRVISITDADISNEKNDNN